MEYKAMDSMESTWDPNIDPALDPQLGLVNVPTPVQTQPGDASKAQPGIATALTDKLLWPLNAKLCDCPEHSETTSPAEHALLFIPDSAKRCHYCPWKTERVAKVGNPAPILRRHDSDSYPGISVGPLRASLKTEYE
ncbi:hypothetical protein N7519_003063 [Penicillium mononematosum]|uniref:uncharacterized protein n=1 Tax=Penicillium mononematosum TaxID=268346 RepID=UPI002549963F|nr:uncharacterized protein N7519_003063 [Penicillium mononematosum]KAJ6188155.1 hypothetical protein N7519_003063 [Penicillium mononematosum]